MAPDSLTEGVLDNTQSLPPSLPPLLPQPSQVGSLFTFLARQGAKHRTSIHVDENIYDHVLNYITHTEEDIVNEERQQVCDLCVHVKTMDSYCRPILNPRIREHVPVYMHIILYLYIPIPVHVCS